MTHVTIVILMQIGQQPWPPTRTANMKDLNVAVTSVIKGAKGMEYSCD